MRRSALACVLSVAVLSACGAQTDSASPSSSPASALPTLGAPVTAPSPTAGPITDSSVLAAAMLTAGDVPDGFVALELPPSDLADPTTGPEQPDRSSTDPAACADVLAPVSTQVQGAAASAAVAYSGPNFSSIDEDAASYADVGAAFAAVQATLAGCENFTGTDADGVRVDYSVGGLDTARVGDASMGARVEITSEGLTLTSDLMIAVVGSTVVQLTATAQEPMDSGVLNAVASAAVGRLGGAGR